MREGTNSREGLGRREALAIIAGGVAVTATAIAAGTSSGSGSAGSSSGSGGSGPTPTDDPRPEAKPAAPARMPVAFLPHGGGPWNIVDLRVPKPEYDALASYLDAVRLLPKTPPRALLVVSAHWEERVPTVMSAPRPPMLYDYYGFPPASYEFVWPAPGAPDVARRVRELLTAAGIESAEDAQRGFDHGTFVPLAQPYPKADIPTTQMSLKAGLDPAEHLAIGRALAPLRDEGVFIVGSGMTYHDLRNFFRPEAGIPVAEAFDAWLRETALLDPKARDERLAQWTQAPSARKAHPREEHLIPLMVVAGAAGQDVGKLDYNGTYYGLRLSGFSFG